MLGILSCLYLMLSLPVITWVRFLVWLDLGMLIYWFYGRTHSPLADKQEAARRTGAENFSNLVMVFGGIAMFNGFALALLSFMPESSAKWHEIHVTAAQGDFVGLIVLGVGAVLFTVGKLMAKGAGR